MSATRKALLAATCLVLSALAPIAPASAAGPVSGPARAVDGDTLELAGIRVRLEGIDAPEQDQTCGRALVGWWRCGEAATSHLAKLLAAGDATCHDRGTDKYGRMLAVCFVGTTDINADMVRQGLAWAFLKYSRTYQEVEAEARAVRAGIWQGDATPAWAHREAKWAGAQQAAPGGCAIKGNVTRNGRIYHMPWSPFYGRTRIDEARGERWFCSEDDAIAAGWRAAGAR